MSTMQENVLEFAKNLVDNPDSYKLLSLTERLQLLAMSKLYELRNQADNEKVDEIGDAIHSMSLEKEKHYQHKLLYQLMKEFLGHKCLRDSLLKGSELLQLIKEKETEFEYRILLQTDNLDAMRKLVAKSNPNRNQENQE
ncbi:hypothetical protein [Bacillus thuringiensis]|uniref:hypothetical protein n=1 Tax=Bacillus thuringiensis TaxID=1428 RepID=UPI0021B35BB2|nr:hypothetical protein [Bacillus thuringiensis]